MQPNTPRQPLGNVLVATDFSENAKHAVMRAASLPIAPGRSLTLFHVVPDGLPALFVSELEDAAHSELNRLAAEAVEVAERAGHGRLDVVTAVGFGPPVAEIVRRARESDAELTVVGRHGQRTFRELLLGSVAERLLRRGERPVLIVHDKPAGPYRKPLAALDLSGTSRLALLLATRLLDASTTSIEVVHGVDTTLRGVIAIGDRTGTRVRAYEDECRQTEEQAVRASLAELGDLGVEWKLRMCFGDVRAAVLAEAERMGADLLALGTHGQSRLGAVLVGSVAEGVVRHATCDVLLCRDQPSR